MRTVLPRFQVKRYKDWLAVVDNDTGAPVGQFVGGSKLRAYAFIKASEWARMRNMETR